MQKMEQSDTLQIVKKWIENIHEIITFQSLTFLNQIFVQQISVLYQNIWQTPDIAYSIVAIQLNGSIFNCMGT